MPYSGEPARGRVSPGSAILEHMFDDLAAADSLDGLNDAALAEAARDWARAENRAAAHKLAVIAQWFARRTGLDTAAEREDWWLDPTWAVATEIGAALGVSGGLASAMLHRAVALRDRLPKVAALFLAGEVSDVLVRAIVSRTALIVDEAALAGVDADLAAQIGAWGPMSRKRTHAAIDALLLCHDPTALRRRQPTSRGVNLQYGSPDDEIGYRSMWAYLDVREALGLQQRLDGIAKSVCAQDPRPLGERRADALIALGEGQDLVCMCLRADCASAAPFGRDPAPRSGTQPAPGPQVVIHVVADAETIADARTAAGNARAAAEAAIAERDDEDDDWDTPTVWNSGPGPAPDPQPLAPIEPFVSHRAAYLIGGGVLPAAGLAEIVDRAGLRAVTHPGDSPPEPRYRPSSKLADYVRCRDLTCRFPNCDTPADQCDIDHTVPYPFGPTHASNLKLLCRPHMRLR